MKVTLRFARAIREIYENLDEEIEVTLEEGATARDALAAANLPQGAWGILLTCDRLCKIDEKVAHGQIITVLPPVSGG
jgi:molybdopterin converting factor small subunit